MEKRPVSFPPESLLEIKKMPFYTVRFINRNPDGIALIVRVENLNEFDKSVEPAASKLVYWCSPEGTWVIALGYALKPHNGRGGSGLIFLNPRQAEDYDYILRLFRQNEIQIIFFSADTKRSFMIEIDYGDQARAEYKKILNGLLATLTDIKNNWELRS